MRDNRMGFLVVIFMVFVVLMSAGQCFANTDSVQLHFTLLEEGAGDGDEIPDEWEIAHFGNLTTATATSDYDGDTFLDRNECIAGTDPGNDLSFLCITSINEDGDNVALEWTSQVIDGTQRFYTVHAAATLEEMATGGDVVASGIEGTIPSTSVSVLPVGDMVEGGYYRVEAHRE